MTDATGYAQAHANVTALWGRAREYPCVKCEKPAHEWAYDWCDDTSENFSFFPEFYMPLCRSCHRQYDHGLGSYFRRRGRAFRTKPVTRKPKTEAEWEMYLREQRRGSGGHQGKVSRKTA